MNPASATPFAVQTPLRKIPAIGPVLQPIVTGLAGNLLALSTLERFYRSLDGCQDAAEFAQRALTQLGVSAQLSAGALDNIPAQGAAIVVANHPFGGLEGLMLIALLLQRRHDVRVLGNSLLWRIPELRSAIIPVDVFGPRRANAAGVRAALTHVQAGGLLALFPAGAVSHMQLPAGHIIDPTWNAGAARLIRKCKAPVTPVHFAGHNSLGFHLAGLIHPLLRTALLPRELMNKRNQQIGVCVGSPLTVDDLRAAQDDETLAALLRLRTYSLAKHSKPQPATPTHSIEPIAAAIPSVLVAAELESLPATQLLVKTSQLQVVYARAAQLPWTLQELGRLREYSFRTAGEGTGRSSDVDLFDNYYLHLICWNPATREIVGAYRVGMIDEILPRYGVRGLYTHSLFKYGSELLDRLHPALELGRSFVRPEYQRDFAPLLALWRGIAEFVARHPHYRVLFGPVSISNDYLQSSRLLLVEFLQRHCWDAELARLIKPRTPVSRRHPLASLSRDFAQLPDLETLSGLLSQLEPDRKGVPVLLRQYLKLGGKLLGFNVDTQFGHAIDGLIMVDLPRTDAKTLQRYMSKEAALAYLARHAEGAAIQA